MAGVPKRAILSFHQKKLSANNILFSSFDQSCAIVKIASLYVNLVRYFAYTHTYECTYTHREQIATVEKKGEEE